MHCIHCGEIVDPERTFFLTSRSRPITCPAHSEETKLQALWAYTDAHIGFLSRMLTGPKFQPRRRIRAHRF
jgi:hypothetical protein